MLNKDNYVPWSSRIIRYARSRLNGKIIVDSIENGPYVRRMIATPGEPDHPILDEVNELRAERLAKTYDPLALMVHSQNPYSFPATHNDQSSSSTHSQQSFPMQPSDFSAGMVVIPGISNQNETGNIVAASAEGTGNGNQVRDLDEIEEVNANCILMANSQQASTSGTQLDKALVYDTDGSAEVQLNENCYDNDIFNMFTQEEQYKDLLEPIPKPQLVPQNDNHVTYVAPSMVQSGDTVETSSAPNEKTRAHQETVYCNLIDHVTQVNMVNCNMRATNAELKSKLTRYKIQEQHIEISQE
nr:ribonuclease H-like domain-containing protein [Tanacetum cinerariifolium]